MDNKEWKIFITKLWKELAEVSKYKEYDYSMGAEAHKKWKEILDNYLKDEKQENGK